MTDVVDCDSSRHPMAAAARRLCAVAAAGLAALALGAAPAAAQPQGPTPAPVPTSAAIQTIEGLVVDVRPSSPDAQESTAGVQQMLDVQLLEGPRRGETVTVQHGQLAAVTAATYEVGDRVLVEVTADPRGGESVYLVDRVRRGPLLALFGVFALLAVVVGRRRGAAALVGMGFSFAVLFAFVLPQITAGRDPLLVVIAAAAVIIPTTFYLTHGVNWKSTAAVAGTLVTLIITGLVAQLAVSATQLTGYVSEEVYFLESSLGRPLNVRGLLLASIIIGLLGILDDITVSQAAVVGQLRAVSAELSVLEIYRRAMDVGKDHIASLVNTLVLVYASSALPLMLLFTGAAGLTFSQAINFEIVAEEIVRTLVASIGLVLAVPITTALACWMMSRGWTDAAPDDGHAQPHAHHPHAH